MLVWLAIPCGSLWPMLSSRPTQRVGLATRFPDIPHTPEAEIAVLRHQSSITSLSWIPSEAVEDSVRIRD